MDGNNIIDVQQLEITPQDADNTYLGIDENGQLIRTKIELSSGGGESDLSNYYTKSEVDEKIENIDIPEVDLSNYYTKQEINNKGYVTDSDVNDYVGNEIEQLEEVINTKQDKITDLDTIRSGAAAGATALQTIPSEYITETELETRLENVGGGDGGSTVVELTGSKPTLDEFNILYESAAAGKPTFVKYDEGVFNIIADNNSVTNRGLYHFYADAFTVYIVFWYNQTNKDTVYDNKSEFVKTNDGIKNKLKSSKDDIKLYSADEYSNLPRYFEDYSSTISAPISTYYGKSGTFLLDGKMYYFDVVNGEKDGIYVKPKVVDLLNISGGDVDLSEYYTKTEIDGLIGDINYVLTSI